MENGKFNRHTSRVRLEPRIRGAAQEKQVDNWEDVEIKSFDLEKFIKRNFIRLIVSVAIFALLFAIKSVPLSMAQKITQGVKWVVTWEEDLLEDRNIIPAMNNQIRKFIGSDEEEIVGEIEKTEQYIAPVEGVVTSPFGEEVHPVFKTKIEAKGIEVSGNSARDIHAIEKGKIIQLQESVYGGKKIIIEHDNDFKSVYEGCYETTAEVNQEINQGDILGKTKAVGEQEKSIFYFELWKGDKAVNPQDYMELEIETAN